MYVFLEFHITHLYEILSMKYQTAALAKRKVLWQSGVRPSRRSSVQN